MVLTEISLRIACKTAVLLSVIGASAAADAEASRGAYLAQAGDCVACHTAGPEQSAYSGGLALNSPFGKIYSTNITPDPNTGIGRYTLEDFSQAMRSGIAKGGKHLYPAMPYPSFAGLSDEDIKALYAYFMTEVAPVEHQPPETKLPFPFNLRESLMFWNALFVKDARFAPHPDQDAAWNRGAYLVQSLGHCGACHTPRGLAFQERAYDESSPLYLQGGLVDNWFAANLRGDPASGLGRWSEAEIADFLETGHNGGSAAFGSMIEVVENSSQYLHKEDLLAIAHYLKSLPAADGHARYMNHSATLPAIAAGEMERPGAGIYQAFCAKCHLETGGGKAGKYPQLAGSAVVLSENPTSLIRLLLAGGETAKTRKHPKPEKMPGFSEKLTDRQIAEVLSFIRSHWGNQAPPVAIREVSSLRRILQSEP